MDDFALNDAHRVKLHSIRGAAPSSTPIAGQLSTLVGSTDVRAWG
jgi:hypothetical protein